MSLAHREIFLSRAYLGGVKKVALRWLQNHLQKNQRLDKNTHCLRTSPVINFSSSQTLLNPPWRGCHSSSRLKCVSRVVLETEPRSRTNFFAYKTRPIVAPVPDRVRGSPLTRQQRYFLSGVSCYTLFWSGKGQRKEPETQWVHNSTARRPNSPDTSPLDCPRLFMATFGALVSTTYEYNTTYPFLFHSLLPPTSLEKGGSNQSTVSSS